MSSLALTAHKTTAAPNPGNSRQSSARAPVAPRIMVATATRHNATHPEHAGQGNEVQADDSADQRRDPLRMIRTDEDADANDDRRATYPDNLDRPYPAP